MVITSRTRNAVARKGTWVRIPPPPPTTNPRKSRVYAGFLMPFYWCSVWLIATVMPYGMSQVPFSYAQFEHQYTAL